ncbi:ABC transporter transmembrane domain-containing protein [Saltatorellus ferox]|uniref:ABC transporter transmembrane domain-containing protein n=1 Tax=Saltatorellus ferox TaxID=2528018 RepID=UPI003AF38E04
MLTRLFEAVGQPFDPALLIQRVALANASPAESVRERLELLAHVGHDFGLRTRTATASVGEALQVVRAGQPLVAIDEQGGRWFLLAPGRGKRVDATVFEESSENSLTSVGDDEILELLGADPETAIHWLVADPATPNEAAASQSYPDKTLTNFQRLGRLLSPERGDLYVVLVFAIMIGILTLATPVAVQAIVNSVAIGGTFQPLIAVAIFLAFALAFAAALIAVQTWVVELLQRRLLVRAVGDIAARLPRVETAAYDDGYGPERVNRFFDVFTIQKSAAKLLIEGLSVLLTVVVGLTVLAFYHPFLLAFDVVLLIVIAALVFGPRRRGEYSAVKESTAKYEVVAWLEEISRNPLTFRAAGAESWIYERADAVSRAWVAKRQAHFRTLFTQVVGALVLLAVASTALLSIGGLLVIQGSLTLGQLVAAELILSAVLAGVAKMGKLMETWYDLMAAVAKVGYLLDLPIESSQGEHHVHSVTDASGRSSGARLDLKGVRFDAPAGLTSIPLADFRIERGERVLVRGLDGAARLAMVDLVWRLRQPSSGVIRLDGRDLRDLAPEFIRREIAVVSKVEWVQGSVRENVRLGRPFVLNDDIRKALDLVGLRGVFADFENGLDAVIYPDARGLSDDDLQRLMLARALAGDPAVLVIDASGHGADSKFHEAIQNVLLRNDGRTVLVLTSDSSPFDGHDRVIDLDISVPAGHSTESIEGND